MQKDSLLDKFTNRATQWIGSTSSLVAHTFFFVFIFILILFGVEINTVLLVLTTAVSLEAIYLSIFIQRSVNQSQTVISEEFDDLEEAISEDIDETEAALKKDLDDTEHNISEDIDETEAKLGKELDDTEAGIMKSTPKVLEKPLDDITRELRKIIREEIKAALKEKK